MSKRIKATIIASSIVAGVLLIGSTVIAVKSFHINAELRKQNENLTADLAERTSQRDQLQTKVDTKTEEAKRTATTLADTLARANNLQGSIEAFALQARACEKVRESLNL